ncbi:hypothetical protein [Chamaesiphon sp.]
MMADLLEKSILYCDAGDERLEADFGAAAQKLGRVELATRAIA